MFAGYLPGGVPDCFDFTLGNARMANEWIALRGRLPIPETWSASADG